YLLLFFVNPILIYYACEARMYSMLAFFATSSFYLFFTKKTKIHIIVSILGLFTHYFMIFPIIAQFVYSILIHKRKDYFQLLKPFVIIFAVFLPWLIFTYFQKGLQVSSFWIPYSTFYTLSSIAGILYTGYELGSKYYDITVTKLSVALIALLILGIVKIIHGKIQNSKLFLMLVIWGFVLPFGIAVISFIKPIFLARYLIFTSVGMLLLIIYILDHINIFLRGLIFAGLILVSINFLKIDLKNHKKSNYRRIITEIKILAHKNDVMYVTSELDFFTAEYYFDENRVFIYGKIYDKIPAFVGKVLIPKNKLVNSLPKYPIKAFILTSDSHYDIESSL
ncbi:MAG: hypothetical protein Q7R95_08410, partial [bacterium]|nr:hypothetical protein [bacterium]